MLHCPDKDCSADRVFNQGPVVEMKTRRTYFLDYPCDLKKGEKVTFVLSLHGAGSYGNWQRNYFPLMDFKDKYRLVIATPNSPTHVWSTADDEYLQNIVAFVVEQLGKENIQAFWLVGHSQGGMTANRLLRTDFFKDRVDGWLSLSGGRLGGSPGRTAPALGQGEWRRRLRLARRTRLRRWRLCESFRPAIFRLSMKPGSGRWTGKVCRKHPNGRRSMLAGRAAVRRRSSIRSQDMFKDSTRQNPPNPAWGLLPAGGKAEVYVYPDCEKGRVVADVVRMGKGHTEALEPKVTEELVKLMVSAKGGKLQGQ